MSRFSIIVVVLLSCILSCVFADELLLNVAGGQIQGKYQSGVRQFLGIPFAAPPTGALRWRKPQPLQAWNGVRNATTLPASCIQPNKEYFPVSEDCLYVNVFAPNGSSSSPTKKAVMVWIYGGAFNSGGSSLAMYDGSFLANNHDVIVVSFNYRVGALGFFFNQYLATENATDYPTAGNYGMMDQVAALKWVQANINVFGGDASNVTLFGESAGAISICFHLVMPQSKGLFKRVILESGSCVQGTISPSYFALPQVASFNSLTFTSKVGCGNAGNAAQVIACLRGKDGTTIASNQGLDWSPIVDQYVIPDDPLLLFFAGRAAQVDMLLGTNTNEGVNFVPANLSDSDYRAQLSRAFSSNAFSVYSTYSYPNAMLPDATSAFAAVFGDYVFICNSRRLARIQAANVNVYQYHFDHIPSFAQAAGFPNKVFHTAEIPFVFGNPPLPLEFANNEIPLVNTISTLWTSFAKTGMPSVTINGTAYNWPAFKLGSEQQYYFNGAVPTVQAFYDAVICSFWDSISY